MCCSGDGSLSTASLHNFTIIIIKFHLSFNCHNVFSPDTGIFRQLPKGLQSLVISYTMSAVSGHLLYYAHSLWSSPILCPQSLVISCTVSAVSGHLLYYVRSHWLSPVLCPQSLIISCTVSAVSGHLLYCVRSLWSSPVLCPQSLIISCTMSAVSGHLLYYICSLWSFPVLCLQSIGSEYIFSCFPPLKSRCVLWLGASYGAKNIR
ncbi:unnamed protein product [Staurois parvus]|uniref:Cytochrome c biogenesis B n=1 Tax=Staurois parvus TaxID=386267 RepID=A0ABN9ADB4_9NEOB|nr:unnamed protein product [Staurois parvus]